MDQRQSQADGNGREPDRRLAVGRPHDDEQEHHGEHHLGDEAGDQAVLAGRVRAVAVGGKALGEIEPRGTDRDGVEGCGGDDGADDLRDGVGQDVLPGEAAACRQANRDGRVEVTARDVADGIGHREHRQAEGERHAEQADAHVREAGSDHGAAATSEGEPEGADALGDAPVDVLGVVQVHGLLPWFGE